jgi:beta-lactamase class D
MTLQASRQAPDMPADAHQAMATRILPGVDTLMRCLCLLFVLLQISPARAEDAELAQLFRAAGASGTLLIEAAGSGQRYVHDAARAAQPFSAASTFKVLNSLIGLQQGAVSGPGAVFHWDGTQHDMAEWNRDQTLASAFRLSCVWCYQQLARRVGAAVYPAAIRAAGFGQLREPFVVDQFWLDGSLTVSAEQQVAFLKRVALRELPYRVESYAALEQIMLAEQTPHYRLYAKTGWSARATPGTGWYVGYVQNARDTWLFALNIDTRSAADLPLRQSIVRAALTAKGILPSQGQ